MIKGVGIDLVDIAELGRRLERTPQIRAQVYDHTELAWCDALPSPVALKALAERFAAKEAVMKALSTGWARGVTFRDVVVEVLAPRAPGERRAHRVRLTGEAARLAARSGAKILLSLSSDGNLAVALALLVDQGVDQGGARPEPAP